MVIGFLLRLAAVVDGDRTAWRLVMHGQFRLQFSERLLHSCGITRTEVKMLTATPSRTAVLTD
jgi:hypothetical protein